MWSYSSKVLTSILGKGVQGCQNLRLTMNDTFPSPTTLTSLHSFLLQL